MSDTTSKFIFPKRGFYSVAHKVAEADFFLEKLRESELSEFEFYFSAFVSSARSITFLLQAVMSHYPGFDNWYPPQQKRLQQSQLARFFVKLRNHSQKVGEIPFLQFGYFEDSKIFQFKEFVPSPDFKEVPIGNVVELCYKYMVELVGVIAECYRYFDVYIDPRVLFTRRGLDALGWTIEDLEESLGLPRGYTDVEWNNNDKEVQRLWVLSRYADFDELLEEYILKYSTDQEVESQTTDSP